MRPLTITDFTATGWNIKNSKVKALVDGILASQDAVFAKYGIKKGIHVAMMMAQFSHESGRGTEIVESLNYSAQRMTEVWHKRFPTIASAEPYAHNEKALAIKTYGGRMGNKPAPSEDGYTYRGRGFIQTTGKNGYADLAKRTGLDLVNHPELVTDPVRAFECAVAEFVNYPGMLDYCEQGHVGAVSGLINTGSAKTAVGNIVGYADRVAETAQWKKRYQI